MSKDIYKLIQKPKNYKSSPKQKRMGSVTDLILGINFSSCKHPLNECYSNFIFLKNQRSKWNDFI